MKIASIAVLSIVTLASLAGTASADIQYDQNVAPDIIFGGGNTTNGGFTTSRGVNGLELGLRGRLRFDVANNQAQNIFNSNGDGSYTFTAGAPTGGAGYVTTTTPRWNFDWSVNTDYVVGTGALVDLNDYTYALRMDGDPTAGTNFQTMDPINVVTADHGIGNNLTPNGGGDNDGASSRTSAQYLALLESNNVAQNSWNYEYFNGAVGTALENFNPAINGIYTIQLEAFDTNGNSAGLTSIDINVVPEPTALAALGLGGLALLRRRRA